MAKLKVSLVTPTRQVARVEVDAVSAPSVMGEVTILPLHRPLLADLQEGAVALLAAEKAERYAVSGGFIEVDRDRVTVLAEAAERADEIDLDRARAALREAESLVKKLEVNDLRYTEEMARARRARVRIQVAGG